MNSSRKRIPRSLILAILGAVLFGGSSIGGIVGCNVLKRDGYRKNVYGPIDELDDIKYLPNAVKNLERVQAYLKKQDIKSKEAKKYYSLIESGIKTLKKAKATGDRDAWKDAMRRVSNSVGTEADIPSAIEYRSGSAANFMGVMLLLILLGFALGVISFVVYIT